jgi:hypothetical protein
VQSLLVFKRHVVAEHMHAVVLGLQVYKLGGVDGGRHQVRKHLGLSPSLQSLLA